MSLGKDPLPQSSSLIMKERSELRAEEVLSRLAEDNAEYEEIIIHDNNLNVAGDLVVNNMLLLHTLIVKNRCFYGGVDVSRDDNVFAVMNVPSLKVLIIGDSFCCFNTFILSSNRIEGFLYRLRCSGRIEYWRRRKRRFPLCSRTVSVKCLIHFIMIGRSPLSSAYYHQEE